MPSPIVYNRDAALSQGISQAGSALGSALGQKILEQKKINQQKEYGNILQKTLGSLPEDASRMDFINSFSNAINQGLPVDIAQNMGTLYKALANPTSSGGLGVDKRDDLVDLFSRFGMEDEQAQREADLYISLPTGGKTSYANFLFDRMQRGQLRSGIPEQMNIQENISITPGGDISEVEKVEVENYDFPKLDTFAGLNSKEKTSRQKDLFNANAKDFQENKTKLRGFEDELRRLNMMSKLNDSEKLPKGMERLNINWTTGDIRYPALANPETQLFVKSVNDFTTKAKETYGARVTNFELGTFMRRLPTLANTTEGRRLILEQMKANDEINKLYYDSLNDVYDHYGLRNIDTQQAEKIAKDLRKDDEKALIEKYNNALQAQEVYEARQLAPEGKIPVRSKEGKIGYILRSQADKAAKQGYEIL
jgi:hypothetical protein